MPDSTNKPTRLIALDLFAAANAKTIDGTVSKATSFKDQILIDVVEAYSPPTALLSKISCGTSWSSAILSRGAHCFDLIAGQFLDLVSCVPDTRPTSSRISPHISKICRTGRRPDRVAYHQGYAEDAS
jgi:hypothetical protein